MTAAFLRVATLSACVGLLAGCASPPETIDSFAGATRVETVAPNEAPSTEAPETPEDETEPEPTGDGFDRSAFSIDDPASPWVIANKIRPLNPTTYAPPDVVLPASTPTTKGDVLRQEAANALDQLSAAAAAEGITIYLTSGYRSYDRQVAVYNGYVARLGQAAADATSARPGFSEHQTGWTADLDDGTGCALDVCFAETPGGSWLAANAATYGFVLRYPFDKTAITGYEPEPWHYRYVGVELAAAIKSAGDPTLEEFFGLPAAPGYQ